MPTGNVAVATTPVVQNAAYSSGNSMGGLLTIPFFVSDALPSGVLDVVAIYSKGGATTALTIYIFDTLPSASTITDKSAFVLAAADVAKLAMPPFALTPAAATGTTVTSASLVQAISVRNQDSTPTNKLYAVIVAGGSVTPATVADLVLKLSGALD